jgi:hypothetical protein
MTQLQLKPKKNNMSKKPRKKSVKKPEPPPFKISVPIFLSAIVIFSGMIAGGCFALIKSYTPLIDIYRQADVIDFYSMSGFGLGATILGGLMLANIIYGYFTGIQLADLYSDQFADIMVGSIIIFFVGSILYGSAGPAYIKYVAGYQYCFELSSYSSKRSAYTRTREICEQKGQEKLAIKRKEKLEKQREELLLKQRKEQLSQQCSN